MRAYQSSTHALATAAIEYAWSKWDGGADGKGAYHVWTGCGADDDATGLVGSMSMKAVVDDFGNLVRVPS